MALVKVPFTKDLSTGALSFTAPAVTGDYKLVAMHAHMSAAISETFKIYRVDPDANYTTQIGRKVIAAVADAVFVPDSAGGIDIPRQDRILVECTNAGLTGIVYGTLLLNI